MARQRGSAELKELLRERFAHREFRPGQERIIRALLDGRDVVAVLPTGAGKSLVYQLTAQLLDGVTVVVSPLLALMEDQVEGLEASGLAVGVLSSLQSASEADKELSQVERGDAKLLYVTPERFENEAFMAELQRMRVSLLVVDEAHSISEWGHTFRPAYLGLGSVAERLGRPTVLALTATATPWVRRDIIERLGLRDPLCVVQGTDRPNLFLEVVRVEDEREDRRVLERLLADMQGSGIVYTATTRAARDTAEWLTAWGIDADFYHGQRRKSDRERVQAAFMAGELRVIAATNAFGLGVDKPDVRFVIHRDVPGSLDEYYQEAGRAGRDGDFARCVLIYRPGDLGRAAFRSAGGQLTREEVAKARAGLRQRREGTLRELAAATGLSRGDLTRLVEILRDRGIVEQARGRLRLRVRDFDPDEVPLDEEEHRRAYERSRLEMMRGYAEVPDCRRRYLLNYFGEDYAAERCAMCDNDLRPRAEPVHGEAPADRVEAPFAIHDRVVHRAWGEGVVHRVTRDSLTVLFDHAGYKTLATDLVLQQGLLEKP